MKTKTLDAAAIASGGVKMTCVNCEWYDRTEAYCAKLSSHAAETDDCQNVWTKKIDEEGC